MLTVTLDVELKCDDCGSNEIHATVEYDPTRINEMYTKVFNQAKRMGWAVQISSNPLQCICPDCRVTYIPTLRAIK